MKKHKLLVYELLSRRRRRIFFVGLLILLTLAVVDLFEPIFGGYWYLAWLATAVLFILWFYYGVLMRRAAIQVRETYMRLQGPLRGVNISYGRISSLSATTMNHHFPADRLSSGQRKLLKPLYQQTLVLAEMNSYPKAMGRRNLWFTPHIFSATQDGLLLAVPDWMQLNRDLEVARTRWHERKQARIGEDKRSLASRILDY